MEEKRNMLEELINEKFKHVNKSMMSNNKNIIRRLNIIDKKFGVLNGRTLTTEEHIHDLKLQNANHITTCPQIQKIENLEDQMDKRMDAVEKTTTFVEMIKNNPKLALMIIAGAVFFFLNSIGFIQNISTSQKINSAIEKVVKEQVRVKQELKDTEVEEATEQFK